MPSALRQHDLDPCRVCPPQRGQIAFGNLKLWIEQRAVDIGRQQPYGGFRKRHHPQWYHRRACCLIAQTTCATDLTRRPHRTTLETFTASPGSRNIRKNVDQECVHDSSLPRLPRYFRHTPP